MKPNMGTADRVIRVLIALAVVLLYSTNQLTGTAAIVLLVLSAIFVITSIISFCPLYFPFGISTKKKE